MKMCARTGIGGALGALALLAMMQPALALDPRPKTYREKQRHDFRDTQLGLSHPAPQGRSTATGRTPGVPASQPAPRLTDAEQ